MSRNLRKNMLCVLFVMLMTPELVQAFIEPFVIGGGIVAASGAAFSYLRCRFQECCTDDWIKPDLKGLQQALRSRLYGQHLVTNALVSVLQSHFNNPNPSKALVLSFHGPTGSGKTFVSRLIAEHLFSLGVKSQFVHSFHAILDFPTWSVQSHKSNLVAAIQNSISKCERFLFIFEEVNEMPSGLLDSLAPFLDYHANIQGKDCRKSVFILISNTGATRITKTAFDAAKAGKRRESLSLSEVQPAISQDALEQPGGLHGSDLIRKGLIDYYVPFLPLERHHVTSCIEDVLQEMENYNLDLAYQISKELKFDNQWEGMYSEFGCKLMQKHVTLALREMKSHTEQKEINRKPSRSLQLQ